MKKTTLSQFKRCWWKHWKRFAFLAVAIATSLWIGFRGLEGKTLDQPLPELQVHPLPPALAQWQDTSKAGNYFSQVKPTPVGYLVWSEFPVKIYVERSANPSDSSASNRRFHSWVNAVLQAMQEWQVYLPLVEVPQPELADIVVMRSRPPLRATFNRETGQFQLPRARSAETRYQFYLRQAPDRQKILSHRLTIYLTPDQSDQYTLATARHEIGHALGIWGHSQLETDALYFSQVKKPPSISHRDINTLKIIYQQPTRLGWSLKHRR